MAALLPRFTLQAAKKQTTCTAVVALQTSHYSSDPRVITHPTTASLKRGTGGRSSFNGIVCTVFGATGFVGRYVCNRLGKIGTQLILPYKGDMYKCLPLKLCGDLGQVLFHPFHLRDEDSIRKCIKYSNVVINLIGREWETRNFTYHEVHVDGARRLARLCKEANVEHFIHVSALNVDSDKTYVLKDGSRFLHTKLEGEHAVREEFPEATIIRPSNIWGQEDRFLRVYAGIMRHHFRTIPIWENGEATEKQPVAVYDVAGGITAIAKDPKNTAGKIYQFVGPKRYKFSELLDWFHRIRMHNPADYGYRRIDLKYAPLFKLKLTLNELFSTAYPLGFVQWELLEREAISDIVSKELPTLEDLGITLTTMESRMHWELKPWRKDPQYMESVGEFSSIPDPPTVAVH
ncbi:NADH dehydrogenase [ubiquinone] 1 alpha subcomplex subunit 9, mitochondrial [Camponotus floridanus]|uniref:NADH dehydrogenase [ubiquinone] 1 alpha subcomplex subunit 9, mitochondrial n=1 Tax=Camponotus floridanus TaxID=104421 RepID=E2AEB6_CAMFO|nr:NADH dehydrogenase [ubiquinone] 1 alpha subcomplex subunit 9, mitochondrial [Camponotus floridanus]EFN68349.1 NADH dehydrogenase [ubiquinone] 1 alpha subcomplex subunit 9, mitochondrial [Camponotus floridanus]